MGYNIQNFGQLTEFHFFHFSESDVNGFFEICFFILLGNKKGIKRHFNAFYHPLDLCLKIWGEADVIKGPLLCMRNSLLGEEPNVTSGDGPLPEVNNVFFYHA